MLLRKYRGKNLKDALRKVKSDLGESATIVSTATVPSGLLGSKLEVIATLAPPEEPPGPIKKQLAAAARTPAAPPPPPTPPSLEIHQVARFLSPIRDEIRSLNRQVKALVKDKKDADAASNKVEVDVDELMTMLQAIQLDSAREAGTAATGGQEPGGQESDPLQPLGHKLRQSGMRSESAALLLERVARRLPRDPVEARASAEALAAQVIMEQIRCAAPVEAEVQPRIVAFVGPPGVGKTTTLAKIATRAALIEGRRVAMVGCDTERIGAIRALQEMAELIGVPFRAARNAAELALSLDELGDQDLILVDTSGLSGGDAAAMTRLRQLLSSAGVEPLLLINADMRSMELDVNLEGFADLEPRALILTKIDQAVALGGMLDATLGSGLPIMHLTTGRRIPEDLEPASPEGIAAQIMGFHNN